MTDNDLVASFRQAKDPAAQVGILADLNGVSHDVMAQHLQALGLPCKVVTRKLRQVPFDTDRAMELYHAGQTDLQIAEQLGVGKTTFANWRREQGLKVNRPPAPQTEKPPRKQPPAPKAAEPVDVMTAKRVAEIFRTIAEWHPDAVVRISRDVPMRKVSLVSEYRAGPEPVLEINVE